ncbi:uncharacterized protein Bfra_005779 [Botrytis fragariae]|uniref:Uncharacterized protein n=1 Tax=Botrytis fragariae TaxID=1964551 RepID=A0A8H6AS72_9HELO|nr:uncharacterized protein Bfra_005779 [Botrytis fragariae]KAF5872420.1 hypothetical protein Bfra_005779 [Botrytis fragariae]
MPYLSSISDTMWMCCYNASRDNQGVSLFPRIIQEVNNVLTRFKCGERNKMKLDNCSKCSHEKCAKCRVTRLQMLMEDFIDTDKVKEALESQLKETPTGQCWSTDIMRDWIG